MLPSLLLAVAAGPPGVMTPKAGPLPAVRPIAESAVATIHLEGSPDFLALAYGGLWVANEGAAAVQRLDPATGRIVAQVPVHAPCGAMGAGFGALWVASCKDRTILRIDARTNAVVARVALPVADPETSIAVGEGGVWVLSDAQGVLSRIDPDTNAVAARVVVAPYSYAAMAGFGAIWVTNTGNAGPLGPPGAVQRVDPVTNAVVARIPVRGQPRFLAVGEGAVWVLNQVDGSVSRIDPDTNRVVETIDVDVPGPGGDIAAGGGFVWVRATKTLLSVIDPATNQVVRRYGPPQGSGAVRVGDGAAWISAHDVATLWKLPAPRRSSAAPARPRDEGRAGGVAVGRELEEMRRRAPLLERDQPHAQRRPAAQQILDDGFRRHQP